MDKNNKQPSDFKSKPSVKYSEDDSKPSTSGYNQYEDKTFRDSKRIETTKRSLTPDGDQNRDGNIVDRKKTKAEDAGVENENQSNISPEEQLPHQQRALCQQVASIPQMPQMNPYANYSYGAPDNFNMDSNQQSYPMMAQFNMYGAMNTQWPCNQVDPMCIPPNNMQVNSAPLPVSTGMDMTPNSSGNMSGYNPYMPMPNDMYNMMGMASWGHYPMYNPDNAPIAPVNEIINLPSCTLIPPHPSTQIRRRERAPGCKTVFVGCLPENITEEIIREIFSRCGEIATIRMSKKNFCHIRFAAMETVDKAMLLSGYKLKIENKDDSANSSRIHVDFAIARDDEYEWKCLQRAREREIRHRERQELEATRPPTPPPVVHYSEHEANLLCDKLKNEETFKDAIHVLVTWLDRGECNRKTCGSFYSMIQCTNSHVKRLINEKNKLDEELNKAKRLLQERMSGISLQFNEINKLFELVKLPHIWDAFNKTQKKSIELMKQTTVDVVEAHSKEVVEERVEDEMELSDDDCGVENPSSSSEVVDKRTKEDVEKMKAAVEAVRKQLQAAIEENTALHQEKEKSACIDNTLYYEKQERGQAMTTDLEKIRQRREEYEASHPQQEIVETPNEPDNREGAQSISLDIPEDDMQFLTLITGFLNVHPHGATVQYICAYLQRVDPQINDRYVENLMQRYPNIFEGRISGIGANLTKTWIHVAFRSRQI